MTGNHKKANILWDITDPNGQVPTWEQVGIAVLMDIRTELQAQNMSKGPWKSSRVCRCGRCPRCRHREIEEQYRERRREARMTDFEREELARIDAQIAREERAA